MKKAILFLVVGIFIQSNSQTIYKVAPGTKGNQIILALSNISEAVNTENIKVSILKESPNLVFNKEELMIERIKANGETEATFSFDIKRDVPVSLKDTIEFIISDNKTVFTTKQIILSYTPPKDYRLEQNFPNPFNPTTTIQYQLQNDTRVILTVYDILGSEVANLINEVQQAGYKEVRFDASTFSSGIYVYRLTAGKFISTKKMMVIK